MTDDAACLEADFALFQAAAAAAGPDAPVPTCPDWTVADLTAHMTRIFTRVEAMVRLRADRRLEVDELPPAASMEAAFAALVETLSTVPPDEPVWNWTANVPKVAGFWARRMACELVVHRVDAELAASGSATPVDAGLAVDALDELLNVILVARVSWGVDVALGGSIHFHCTDVEGEWVLSVADGVVDVVRSHAKADAAVRGPASDVVLWAYNRLPEGSAAVEAFGDESVLAAWRQSARF